MEKKTKTIKEQGRKQVKVLEVLKSEENEEETKSVEALFLKEMRTNEMKTKKWEEIIKRKSLKHETSKYRFDFQQDLLVIVSIMVKLIKKKQR